MKRISLFLGALAFVTSVSCSKGYTKDECNAMAEEQIPLYAAFGSRIGSLPCAPGVTPCPGPEETQTGFATLAILNWYICVEGAETDHVNTSIPLAPIWERLEFKL